ncbi:hypothetical protein KQX54_007321 [Cotesia glomerata]|uniref:Uncharacterized protein n=1 Tax=Cotesia glomerata TaxID=32391 RepID=A0AAV7J559_COTGL|nr:hypothetical protein KQX54_007321 [Cotesia glomerata]
MVVVKEPQLAFILFITHRSPPRFRGRALLWRPSPFSTRWAPKLESPGRNDATSLAQSFLSRRTRNQGLCIARSRVEPLLSTEYEALQRTVQNNRAGDHRGYSVGALRMSVHMGEYTLDEVKGLEGKDA